MAKEKLSKPQIFYQIFGKAGQKLVFSALEEERSSDEEALSDEESTEIIVDEQQQITSDPDACGTSDNEDQAVAAEGPHLIHYSKVDYNSVKIEFDCIVWFDRAVISWR